MIGRDHPTVAHILSRPVRLLHVPPKLNACGPYATAMAIGFYRREAISPEAIAHDMRFFRVPGVGATLPWGVIFALRRQGLIPSGGWFTRFAQLRGWLDADQPVIVLVKPVDLVPCRWYALHYRVLVGYRDDPQLPGGGELYFNCSASPAPVANRLAAGNVTLDYATFLCQWRTYLTYHWAVAVSPR